MNSEFWNRKRVLVTGGYGFVGRWLCRLLQTAEVDLHILDLAPSHTFEARHYFHQTDMRQLPALIAMLDEVQPQLIIHLAGQPGVAASHDDPLGAYEANVLTTFNLLEACRRAGRIQGILAASSNHVYGEQEQHPTGENVALNGTAMYAASKLCGDVLARSYACDYQLPVTIARLTNSFGGDDHHITHIVTGSILAALRGERPVIKGSGRDLKGYLYIKDTVEGLARIAEAAAASPHLRGAAFNLAPDEPISVTNLVKAIITAVGSKMEPDIREPEKPFEHEHLDNRKAHELLGWSPRYSLSDALQETVAWYRDHRPAVGSH
jgi:CDP-glucose 4,6-dehydratase